MADRPRRRGPAIFRLVICAPLQPSASPYWKWFGDFRTPAFHRARFSVRCRGAAFFRSRFL